MVRQVPLVREPLSAESSFALLLCKCLTSFKGGIKVSRPDKEVASNVPSLHLSGLYLTLARVEFKSDREARQPIQK